MNAMIDYYLTEEEVNELRLEAAEFMRDNPNSSDKDMMNKSQRMAESYVDNMLCYNNDLINSIYSLSSLEELYEDMTKLVSELSDEIYYAMVDSNLA